MCRQFLLCGCQASVRKYPAQSESLYFVKLPQEFASISVHSWVACENVNRLVSSRIGRRESGEKDLHPIPPSATLLSARPVEHTHGEFSVEAVS